MKLTVRHQGSATGGHHDLYLRLLGATLGYVGGAAAYAGAVCFATCVLEGGIRVPLEFPRVAMWVAAGIAGPLGAWYGASRFPAWVLRR